MFGFGWVVFELVSFVLALFVCFVFGRFGICLFADFPVGWCVVAYLHLVVGGCGLFGLVCLVVLSWWTLGWVYCL